MTRQLMILVFITLASACATTKEPPDYTNFLESKPASILVLPPANQSVEVTAPSACLSVLSQPIAEKGYYVLPVSLVSQYFKENGVTVAEDIHQIPVKKLYDVFGADAVMYITIQQWGQQYQVVNSAAKVIASIRLVDARNGAELWNGDLNMVQSSQSGSGGLLESMLVAAVTQMMASDGSISLDLARDGSHNLFFDKKYGLINGPRAASPDNPSESES